MNHHKNFQKALLSGLMIGILSLVMYGFTAETLRYTTLPNILITFVIVFVACWFVDKAYEIVEKRRKKHGNEAS